MIEYLSATLAISGKSSVISVPGTLVGIGLKKLRTLGGALGLGSKVSMCVMPPSK